MSTKSLSSQDIFATFSKNDLDAAKYFVSELWPCEFHPIDNHGALGALSCYWQDQLAVEEPLAHCVKSLDDARNLAAIINANPTLPKANLLKLARTHFPNIASEGTELRNSLNLVSRLLLMVNIQSHSFQGPQSLSTGIMWPDSMSLADILHPSFKARAQAQVSHSRRYTRLLNVYNLERIGGFGIQWTDNFADHLKFEDSIIYIFYHVSALRRMKGTVNGGLLPTSIFDETLDTLSLLIPRSNRDCVHWFRYQQTEHLLDPELLNIPPAPREVSHYSFWRERLEILGEEFDDSEPKSLTQWWFDKRKRVQWSTFWVAIFVLILTIIFGVIQTVTGIVQAWASVQSMKGTS